MRRTSHVLVAAHLLLAVGAAGQSEPPDTATVTLLDELVVTAHRVETPTAASVGAVTRLGPEELAAMRFGTGLDVLRRVPGFALLDGEGGALDPQLVARGFYGGGETDYVVVLVDGRPVQALHSGRITSELVPFTSVEAVEVIRGPVSSLYGDAAVAGVVNFITAQGATPGGQIRLLTTGTGYTKLGASVGGRLGGRPLQLRASATDGTGFREGGERTVVDVDVSHDLLSREEAGVVASLRSSWRSLHDPGPVSGDALAARPVEADPFFRLDEWEGPVFGAALNGWKRVGPGAELAGSLAGELRRSTTVRTVPLGPDFADTKERELGERRLDGSVQLTWAPDDDVRPVRVIAGLDGSLGGIDSRYRSVTSGSREHYATVDPTAGPVEARGDGTRLTTAVFTQLDVWPDGPLKLSLGARYDRISDEFTPRAPSPEVATRAVHAAFSPKAGVNVRWIATPALLGRLYATVSRSFKAPTPDQLFDQRAIPLPFPPFSATSSNATLVPQSGTSYELGSYSGFPVGTGRGSLTVSTYWMDMENELDFDLSTLQYVNIGRSRHRGVEAGARLAALGDLTAHVTYTLQSAISRAGETSGKELRAIPRHSWSTGLTVAVSPELDAGADLTGASGVWLDDDNTVELPGHERLDLRATLRTQLGTGFLEVRNVLDQRYQTTGYPDPAGSDLIYYFPAPGRTLGVGWEVAW